MWLVYITFIKDFNIKLHISAAMYQHFILATKKALNQRFWIIKNNITSNKEISLITKDQFYVSTCWLKILALAIQQVTDVHLRKNLIKN